MMVVADTTPLIGLATIGRLGVLQELFEEVFIPQAVYDETVTHGRIDGRARHEVEKASWIRVIQVKDRLAVDLLLDEMDLGEVETIVLAVEMKADWVLMDERKGRRKLTQLSIPKIGTLGILLRAKELGMIQNLEKEIAELQKTGFVISQSVIDEILKAAGE